MMGPHHIRTQASTLPVPASGLARRVDDILAGMVRHWLLAANSLLGILAVLPWLAPTFMWLGWQWPARLIYAAYSLLCHQLPERSWFLFGPHFTPTLAEIQAASGLGTDMWTLRTFIGDPGMGWKLAWSDRMVSFYGGWFLFGLAYAVLRRHFGHRVPGRLNWRAAAALLVPMFVDGISHMVSDFWGIGAGFRDSNAWLAALTGHLLPTTFYAGDAWGSFNSLARLGTGLMAAYALMFWLLPALDRQLAAGPDRSRPTIS